MTTLECNPYRTLQPDRHSEVDPEAPARRDQARRLVRSGRLAPARDGGLWVPPDLIASARRCRAEILKFWSGLRCVRCCGLLLPGEGVPVAHGGFAHPAKCFRRREEDDSGG